MTTIKIKNLNLMRFSQLSNQKLRVMQGIVAQLIQQALDRGRERELDALFEQERDLTTVLDARMLETLYKKAGGGQ